MGYFIVMPSMAGAGGTGVAASQIPTKKNINIMVINSFFIFPLCYFEK
jgi:hypothetical protein